MVVISGDFLTVPEKSCIVVFIGEILYPLLLATCFTSQTAIAADCSLVIASHAFDTPGGSMPEVGCVAPQDAILHGHLRLEIGVGVVIHRPLWKPLPQRSQILARQGHIEL